MEENYVFNPSKITIPQTSNMQHLGYLSKINIIAHMNIMIKRFILFISVISSFLSAYASIDTDLVNSLYEYQNKGGYSDESKLRLLQMLRGDTITFDFGGIEKNTLFSTDTPDTIWIKKRPKKNPKEGKHYKLHYVYKGIADENGDYYTPTSEIEGKQFSIISVNSLTSSNYYSYDKYYVVQLADVNTLDVVKFTIPERLTYNISISSVKVNRIIDSLEGKVFYIRTSDSYSSKKTYTKTVLKNGDFSILLESGLLSDFTPQLNLNFVSDSGISVPYKKDSYSYRSENDKLISESEYLEYQESVTPRHVNSVVDDSILNSNVEMPFQFGYIMGLVSGYVSTISQEIDPTERYGDGLKGYSSLPSNSVVLIADKFSIRENNYYKALFNGKAFFINAKDVTLTDEMNNRLDSVSLCDKSQKEYFFQNLLLLSRNIYAGMIKELSDELSSFKKYGLAIKSWGVYDESEYTDGTGISFNFFNPTSKTVKYITIRFVGYNAVDDPVSSGGGYTLTRKCIGPIGADETASYVFEYVWFTDIVQYAKIKSIVVQYTDGTSKTISNARQITFSDALEEFVSNSNPVQDFR